MMKNLGQNLMLVFFLFLFAGCYVLTKHEIKKTLETETLKKGNVRIFVENNIDTNDVVKVFVDDSLLRICSGITGLDCIPIAFEINYQSYLPQAKLKVTLNDSIVVRQDLHIQLKKVSSFYIRKKHDTLIID